MSGVRLSIQELFAKGTLSPDVIRDCESPNWTGDMSQSFIWVGSPVDENSVLLLGFGLKIFLIHKIKKKNLDLLFLGSWNKLISGLGASVLKQWYKRIINILLLHL